MARRRRKYGQGESSSLRVHLARCVVLPTALCVVSAAASARAGVPSAAAESTSAPSDSPTGIAFQWEVPPECPTREQVIEDVRGLVTRNPVGAAGQPLQVRGVVRMLSANRWALRMELAGSVRELHATTCGELSRAAALLLALLLDPLEPRVSKDRPSPEPRPTKTSVASSPPAVATPTGNPYPSTWFVGGGVLIDTGLLPSPEPLATVRVGFWFERVSVALHLAAGLYQEVVAQDRVLARLSPRLAVAEGCYRSGLAPRLEGRLCGTIEAGLMHADLVDLMGAARREWAWAGAGAAVLGSFRLGHGLFLEPSVSGSVPVVSPEFFVQEVGIVHGLRPSLRGSLQAVLTL